MAQSWHWRADATLAAALLLAPTLLQCRSDEQRSSSTGAASRTAVRSSATPQSASAAPSASASPPAGSSATAVETTDDGPLPVTLAEQRTRLLGVLRRELAVSDNALHEVQKVIEASDWFGQGNPRVSRPSMTLAECRARRAKGEPRRASAVCGAANMVALFDPERGETERDARVCIDQYEFPNVPCEYPVVWVRSSEASSVCHALGKRLCDAHEWEGGCAGKLLAPEAEYPWSRLSRVYEQRDQRTRTRRRLQLEYMHNTEREIVWAYGKTKDHARCATSARKDPRCTVVDWGICGTNSFPTGAFPECVSPLGVYDQHGNVAEHMSLPVYPKEVGGAGWTEMKGSWFLFAREETHPDDCRWRALNWHTTRVDHWNSHRNYHLGFRCCKDVGR